MIWIKGDFKLSDNVVNCIFIFRVVLSQGGHVNYCCDKMHKCV